MNDKKYTVYDFRKAGSTDATGVSFKIWIEKASQRIAESWSELSTSDVTLQVDQLQTKSYGKAVEVIPSSSIGCVVNFNESAAAALWHFSQTDALTVIASLLGLPADAERLDRELTKIEENLCSEVFTRILQWLGESWPNQNTLPCQIGEVLMNPKRLRLIRPNDLVTAATLILKLPHGDVTLNWISQKEQTAKLLEAIADRRSKGRTGTNPLPIVERLPIEVVGVLGETTMSISNLAALKVGDVVVLNQKIDRPVVAAIDQQPYYHCWPGKVGNHQGLEVSTCLEVY